MDLPDQYQLNLPIEGFNAIKIACYDGYFDIVKQILDHPKGQLIDITIRTFPKICTDPETKEDVIDQDYPGCNYLLHEAINGIEKEFEEEEESTTFTSLFFFLSSLYLFMSSI